MVVVCLYQRQEIDETLREMLRTAIRGIAAEHQEALLDLLDDVSPPVVSGAVRLVAELQIVETAPRVATLMSLDMTWRYKKCSCSRSSRRVR